MEYTGTEKPEYKGNKVPTVDTRMPEGYTGSFKGEESSEEKPTKKPSTKKSAAKAK